MFGSRKRIRNLYIQCRKEAFIQGKYSIFQLDIAKVECRISSQNIAGGYFQKMANFFMIFYKNLIKNSTRIKPNDRFILLLLKSFSQVVTQFTTSKEIYSLPNTVFRDFLGDDVVCNQRFNFSKVQKCINSIHFASLSTQNIYLQFHVKERKSPPFFIWLGTVEIPKNDNKAIFSGLQSLWTRKRRKHSDPKRCCRNGSDALDSAANSLHRGRCKKKYRIKKLVN